MPPNPRAKEDLRVLVLKNNARQRVAEILMETRVPLVRHLPTGKMSHICGTCGTDIEDSIEMLLHIYHQHSEDVLSGRLVIVED